MDDIRISPSKATADVELKLDLAGLLGSTQVFAAGGDVQLQAEMIDAHCNKLGSEGCCCTA